MTELDETVYSLLLDDTIYDFALEEALMNESISEEYRNSEEIGTDAQVFGLFYQIWDAFLRLKFPTATEDLIAGWVDNIQIELQGDELLCWFDAPVEWEEFKRFYNETVTTMQQALLNGIDGVKEGEVEGWKRS